eukprot:6188185-Pleurochrysis_carterae.AAC.2
MPIYAPAHVQVCARSCGTVRACGHEGTRDRCIYCVRGCLRRQEQATVVRQGRHQRWASKQPTHIHVRPRAHGRISAYVCSRMRARAGWRLHAGGREVGVFFRCEDAAVREFRVASGALEDWRQECGLVASKKRKRVLMLISERSVGLSLRYKHAQAVEHAAIGSSCACGATSDVPECASQESDTRWALCYSAGSGMRIDAAGGLSRGWGLKSSVSVHVACIPAVYADWYMPDVHA